MRKWGKVCVPSLFELSWSTCFLGNIEVVFTKKFDMLKYSIILTDHPRVLPKIFFYLIAMLLSFENNLVLIQCVKQNSSKIGSE